MRPVLALGLAVLLGMNLAPDAHAQSYSPETPTAVSPNTPFVNHPRVERTLQFLVDPIAARKRRQGENIPYSDHPLFDAAPNIVNVASFALVFGSNSTLNALAFGLPPAIRATRVMIWGSPVGGPPRDTLLWIVEPSLLHIRNRIRDKRAATAATCAEPISR